MQGHITRIHLISQSDARSIETRPAEIEQTVKCCSRRPNSNQCWADRESYKLYASDMGPNLMSGGWKCQHHR
jgi:hypothetical protein